MNKWKRLKPGQSHIEMDLEMFAMSILSTHPIKGIVHSPLVIPTDGTISEGDAVKKAFELINQVMPKSQGWKHDVAVRLQTERIFLDLDKHFPDLN